MSGDKALFELDPGRMRALLGELGDRLERRGVGASIYLVGGAAMALSYGRQALTPDIDAVVSHQAVLDEARKMATQHGLPESWLNTGASAWVPPLPPWALEPPGRPGLTVHVAPPEHVLAMKLIAARRKDRPDIRLLIAECGMADVSGSDYADLLERVYDGEGLLAQMLGIADAHPTAVREEALKIGAWAHEFAAPLRHE